MIARKIKQQYRDRFEEMVVNPHLFSVKDIDVLTKQIRNAEQEFGEILNDKFIQDCFDKLCRSKREEDIIAEIIERELKGDNDETAIAH